MRFLQFVCVLAMACFPLMSMAFSDRNHYSKVTATVDPTGAGKVYVAKSTSETLDYQDTHSAGTETDRWTEEHTYYLYYRLENVDYTFSGWYDGNTKKSSDNPYTAKVKGNQGELAEYTYQARFTRRQAVLSVGITALEMEARPNTQVTATFNVSGQYIYKGGVDISVNNSAFTVNPTHLTKAQAETGATITVTYKPTANQDYTGKVTIKTTSSQSEDHITDTKVKEVTLNGYSTGYPVTIGSAGATTLYVDMPLFVPSNEVYPGLQVFYAHGIADKEGGKKELNLTSLKNNIPANTGVIIIGAQGEYYFLKYRGSALSPIGDNWLSGTTTGTTREAVLSNASEGSIVMTLSKMNNQLGFYKYVNDNLAANKAYLVYKPAAGSNVTYFSFGDESGVETDDISVPNVKVVKVDDAWYTLQGARLNGQPTQRGIYIHGGKKVIVK